MPETRAEPPPGETSRADPVVRATLGATALVALAHLAFLTLYPRVMIDEAWNANTAWGWLGGSFNFDRMHAGTLDRFGAGWVRRPYLGTLPWVLSFAVAGVGLAQARLVSWAGGVALLALTYATGRRMYGPRAGAITALVLSVTPAFTQAGHWARPDMLLAVVVLAGFALAGRALDADSTRLAFAAGFVLGLGLDVHQNALLFAPGLGALFAIEHGTGVLRRRGTWACAAGGMLGIGLYLVGHVLPAPHAYRAIFHFNFSETHRLPILDPAGLPRSFWSELARFGLFDHGLATALVVVAFAALLARRTRADLRLIVYAGSAFTCFGLFAGAKYDYYGIQLVTFFALAVGAAAAHGLERTRSGTWARRAVVLAVVAAVVPPAIHVARGVHARIGYEYEATTARLARSIAPDDRVMALPTWWLGLTDTDFTSTLNLFYERFHDDVSFEGALARFHPDILVVEEHTRRWLAERGELADLEAVLAERGTLVDSFADARDPWHGRLDVYRLDWRSAATAPSGTS